LYKMYAGRTRQVSRWRRGDACGCWRADAKSLCCRQIATAGRLRGVRLTGTAGHRCPLSAVQQRRRAAGVKRRAAAPVAAGRSAVRQCRVTGVVQQRRVAQGDAPAAAIAGERDAPAPAPGDGRGKRRAAASGDGRRKPRAAASGWPRGRACGSDGWREGRACGSAGWRQKEAPAAVSYGGRESGGQQRRLAEGDAPATAPGGERGRACSSAGWPRVTRVRQRRMARGTRLRQRRAWTGPRVAARRVGRQTAGARLLE
jgi:hypothetical protein